MFLLNLLKIFYYYLKYSILCIIFQIPKTILIIIFELIQKFSMKFFDSIKKLNSIFNFPTDLVSLPIVGLLCVFNLVVLFIFGYYLLKFSGFNRILLSSVFSIVSLVLFAFTIYRCLLKNKIWTVIFIFCFQTSLCYAGLIDNKFNILAQLWNSDNVLIKGVCIGCVSIFSFFLFRLFYFKLNVSKSIPVDHSDFISYDQMPIVSNSWIPNWISNLKNIFYTEPYKYNGDSVSQIILKAIKTPTSNNPYNSFVTSLSNICKKNYKLFLENNKDFESRRVHELALSYELKIKDLKEVIHLKELELNTLTTVKDQQLSEINLLTNELKLIKTKLKSVMNEQSYDISDVDVNKAESAIESRRNFFRSIENTEYFQTTVEEMYNRSIKMYLTFLKTSSLEAYETGKISRGHSVLPELWVTIPRKDRMASYLEARSGVNYTNEDFRGDVFLLAYVKQFVFTMDPITNKPVATDLSSIKKILDCMCLV